MRTLGFSSSVSTKQFYLLFALVLGFVAIADSIMGYMSPIYMTQIAGSTTGMGWILATSSMVGLTMDFLFAKLFPHKRSKFFIKLLFVCVFLFPLSFLLFHTVWAAVFAMAVWGIYFEAMVFANFKAIHESVAMSEHGWAWAIAGLLRNIAWSIGPFIASSLYTQNAKLPLVAAIVANAIGLFVAIFYLLLKKTTHISREPVEKELHTFAQQVAVWKVYSKTLWPLLLFNVFFYIIESAFFSVGPLLGEQLKTTGQAGSLFVSMYSIPGIIVSFFIVSLSKPWGKKRLSYIGGILAGLGLFALGFSELGVQVLLFGFIAAIGLGLQHPALLAVFEDYVVRSKQFGTDIVGLTAMSGSFAYIVGPILNGMMADRWGNQAVFGIWGTVMLLFSCCLFVIVKRKVHLPQAQVISLTVAPGS